MSWSWGALLGLHGIPEVLGAGESQGTPWWIGSVKKAHVLGRVYTISPRQGVSSIAVAPC